MVVHIENLDDFNAALKNAEHKLVVVDFTAEWCGPCQKIGPIFEALSKKAEYQNVVFLKVDVDNASCVLKVPYLMNRYRDGAQRGYWLLDVSSYCDITCMPTFQFYKNGEKIYQFSGANQETLELKIKEHK